MTTAWNRKIYTTLTVLMVAAFVFTCLGVSSGEVYAQEGSTDSSTADPAVVLDGGVVVASTNYYTEVNYADKGLVASIIHGPSTAPAGFASQRTPIEVFPATAKTLSDVPAFSWVFGCSAVSSAMIAGYYDRTGYSNMYTGPTNGGLMPLTDTSWPLWTDSEPETYPNNPLVASHKGIDGRTTKGSIDDYWVYYNSSANDPYISGGWTQHAWSTSIGDYMKTSQSAYDNTDGATVFYNWRSLADPLTCADMVSNNITVDGTYGRKLFYQARGYTVTDCYNQKTDNNGGGFTFAKFQAEINAGHPVLLNLYGHSIVGLGYDTASNTVYIHDTWGNYTTSMPWGGSYYGMELMSVSVVNLKAVTPVPTLVSPTGQITDPLPTYKWKPVSGATKYEVQLYKGSTVLLDTILSSSVCTSTLCSYKPNKTLTVNTTYKWRVRAYKNTWSSYSSYMTFLLLSAAGVNFNSTFTNDAAGWTPVKGSWGRSAGLYYSPGVSGVYASTKHEGIYTNVIYTARVKRTTSAVNANALMIRGDPTSLDASYRWKYGYAFQYSNSGYSRYKV